MNPPGTEAATVPASSPWRAHLVGRCRRVQALRTRVLRRGGEEAVHDLRVATRRLQEILAFLEPFLPAREARRLIRRARRIRRSLGETRNADVLRRLVSRLAAELSPAHGGALRALRQRLPGRVRRLPRPLPGIRKRVAGLISSFRDPPPRAVQARAEALLEERLAQMALARVAARRGSPESMHRLRIAVKRYRYLLEILAFERSPGSEAALRDARAVQKSLGELHDLDMLRELARGSSSKTLQDALHRVRRRHLEQTREILATLPSPGIRPSQGIGRRRP